MAKLVEILARELKEWPEMAGNTCSQDPDLEARFEAPQFDCYLSELADDAAKDDDYGGGVEVTRAEWQAAVDALKAKDIASSTAAMIDAGWIDPKPPASPSLHAQVVGRANRIPEWDGAGLPPVGTICENVFPGEIWREVIIIAHDGDMAVFRLNNSERLNYFGDTKQHFRPIRTPEQIAAEEREKVVKELYYTINWSESPDHWSHVSGERKTDYAKAIDAGYRKQEPK